MTPSMPTLKRRDWHRRSAPWAMIWFMYTSARTTGNGHVDWATTFSSLKKMEYSGWLTIEAFGRAMPALAAATKVWRDLFPNPEEVYEKGIKFINEMWAKA